MEIVRGKPASPPLRELFPHPVVRPDSLLCIMDASVRRRTIGQMRGGGGLEEPKE